MRRTVTSRRRAPSRRPHARRGRRIRRRASWRTLSLLLLVGFLVVSLIWAALARAFAPTGNTAASRFDTLIVLGSPADADGNPTPSLLASVNEGVKEYERGVAPHIIFTGGYDGRPYIQASVMARAAQARGVPASAIFLEPAANDTIHNACYSVRIMKAHGWRSAEVITGAAHLPRAGMIFSHTAIEWRAHAAPSLEPTRPIFPGGKEILKTARYLLYAQWTDACSP